MSKFIEVTECVRNNITGNLTLNIDKIVYIKSNCVYFSNQATDYIILDDTSIAKLKEELLK